MKAALIAPAPLPIVIVRETWSSIRRLVRAKKAGGDKVSLRKEMKALAAKILAEIVIIR